jgi:hypothetical protein
LYVKILFTILLSSTRRMGRFHWDLDFRMLLLKTKIIPLFPNFNTSFVIHPCLCILLHSSTFSFLVSNFVSFFIHRQNFRCICVGTAIKVKLSLCLTN